MSRRGDVVMAVQGQSRSRPEWRAIRTDPATLVATELPRSGKTARRPCRRCQIRMSQGGAPVVVRQGATPSAAALRSAMKRRTWLRAMAGAAILPARAAHANRPGKTHRVGMLMTTTPEAASHVVAAFAEGMRELGHVEGQNVIIEYRWAEGRPERFAEQAADLVREKVDVIVASSQGPALAARRATTTIPIVMVNVTDPVGVGLVASLARPAGNVTGLSQQLTAEIRAKQLQLLKEALPKMSRVSVLRSAATTVGLSEYEAAGRALGLRIQFVEVRGADDLGRAFAALGGERIEALLVPGDTLLFTERQRVTALAPRAPAGYVDKILRGANPATLPVESPTQYELVINLATAKAIGLTIPQTLLLRADQLIE